MPRLNISSNKQVCISRRCHGDGTHESETTRHPINQKQVKTRQTITTYTTIRYCGGHSGRNLLTNTRARQQQNTLGLHISKESRRLCSKQPNGKVSKNVQQRHAINLCFLYLRPKLYQGRRLKHQEKKRSYYEHTKKIALFVKTEDLNLGYTRWTMKHQNMLKILLQPRTLNSSTPPPNPT